MNRFRKQDSEDPTHKWIGTYNSNLIHVVKFFKWLHYPNIEPTKRLKLEVVQNFPKLRRLEISDYEYFGRLVGKNLILRHCAGL